MDDINISPEDLALLDEEWDIEETGGNPVRCHRTHNEVFHQDISHDPRSLKGKWRLCVYVLTPDDGVAVNEETTHHPTLQKAAEEADRLRQQKEGEMYDTAMREMGGV